MSLAKGTTNLQTQRPRPAASGGLARYVLAATLARSADGGAVVAIVLMATTSGAPGWLAGLLGVCITAPHLFGPFIAGSVDTARDGRTVIALACMAHGVTLGAAVLLYPMTWPIVPALLLIASGLVGPLLTGGISSRLAAIAGSDRTSQRRAQGWDVATYGIGGTIGPSLVAAVSAWASPEGVLNSRFFAATLAARSEYAPAQARGQVFVWIGALKITAGSAGTALAGAIVAPAVHLPLVLAAALIAVAVAASILDRRLGRGIARI